jgi:hypothetical protein
MKYVAWYTSDSIYEEVFNSHLKPSLEKYNLEYVVYPMPNYKKWNLNVCQKPGAILKALEEIKEPLVVVDVDAKITGEPVLFDRIDPERFDMACHFLDWSSWYNRPNDTTKELLTGTMWFNYNPDILKLCKIWSDACQRNKCADQKPLEYLLKDTYNHIRVCKLPVEYCYITSLPNGQPPFVDVKKPVISHFQASRSAKRGVL